MKATNCKRKTFFLGGGGTGQNNEAYKTRDLACSHFLVSKMSMNKHEVTTILDYYSFLLYISLASFFFGGGGGEKKLFFSSLNMVGAQFR
jgi:hypothetical protein